MKQAIPHNFSSTLKTAAARLKTAIHAALEADQWVVRDAVQLVLMDKGFKIPSSSAKTAVETAEKLLEWCSQAKNKEVFGQFATDLLQELHG